MKIRLNFYQDFVVEKKFIATSAKMDSTITVFQRLQKVTFFAVIHAIILYMFNQI